MFPSAEYIAGLFDGEGSLSFHFSKWRAKDYCTAVIRVANSNRQVLELIRNQFGGTLHTYQPRYPGARLNHVLHMHRRMGKRFLEAIIPHLIVKRNIAWIVLCFLERGMKPQSNSVKGHQGWQRLTDGDRELRATVRELVMKINGRHTPYAQPAPCQNPIVGI
jgi:hypothetical protein